jgi:hypothetical protein
MAVGARICLWPEESAPVRHALRQASPRAAWAGSPGRSAGSVPGGGLWSAARIVCSASRRGGGIVGCPTSRPDDSALSAGLPTDSEDDTPARPPKQADVAGSARRSLAPRGSRRRPSRPPSRPAPSLARPAGHPVLNDEPVPPGRRTSRHPARSIEREPSDRPLNSEVARRRCGHRRTRTSAGVGPDAQPPCSGVSQTTLPRKAHRLSTFTRASVMPHRGVAPLEPRQQRAPITLSP